MPSLLINAYTHCPVCGSADFPGNSVMRQCQNCRFTDFNNPIVAVGIWILDAEDHLLLIERAKNPGKGMLSPPGGFVDAGESVETAAIREVREETGIAVGPLHYLTSAPNNYTYQGRTRPVCDIFFSTRIPAIEVTPEPGEVSGWCRVPWRDLDPNRLAFDSMRMAYQALKIYLDSPLPK